MYTKFGWNNNNMFLLTRDYPLEPITEPNRLLYYANQVLCSNVKLADDELDRFGRNRIDRMFIILCIELHVFVVCNDITFEELTCEKTADDRYVVRFRYDNENREMELADMVEWIFHNRRIKQ